MVIGNLKLVFTPLVVTTLIITAVLVAASIALQVYCVINIARNGVRTMDKGGWIGIVIAGIIIPGAGSCITSLLYIILGAVKKAPAVSAEIPADSEAVAA